MNEIAPKVNPRNLPKAFNLLADSEHRAIFTKIDNEYLYWDKAKYLVPEGIAPDIFWHAIKLRRQANVVNLKFGNLSFHFIITGKMQQLLHEFDMNFGGNLGSNSIIPEKDHKIYLVSSIMEEAIASSQMEGASTTRKIAKDMLRKQAKPADKSQQMIVNNYATIQYLVDHKDDVFTPESLLYIHKLISNKTLNNPAEEGALRKDNSIYVMNDITGEIVHTPPAASETEKLLSDLCDFANESSNTPFIHPIIKGIIIHFMLAYIHPFTDGNGRTARTLVYWYLLKNGYWLTEYLSISRIIYRSKASYEKSFLYTEADDMDMSYFINYNLVAMKKAYEDLKLYLQRKINEQRDSYKFHGSNNINERQAQIIKLLTDNPQILLTAKELANRFPVSIKTARTDLQHLVELKILMEAPINKRTVGYIRTEEFGTIVAGLMNK